MIGQNIDPNDPNGTEVLRVTTANTVGRLGEATRQIERRMEHFHRDAPLAFNAASLRKSSLEKVEAHHKQGAEHAGVARTLFGQTRTRLALGASDITDAMAKLVPHAGVLRESERSLHGAETTLEQVYKTAIGTLTNPDGGN